MPLAEAVLEQFGHQRLVLRHGNHAVTDVPRGQYIKIAPQPSGASAVIGYRDNCGQVEPGLYWRLPVFAQLQALEAVQERGETSASPDRHNPKRFGAAASWLGHRRGGVYSKDSGP